MRREKRRSKIVINITSMIDVIFLLLLFFLVTTTFSEQPGLKIELPRARSSETQEGEELVLSITRSGDLFLNQQPVNRTDLPGLLQHEARKQKEPTLILRADRTITYGLIVELMDVSRQAGLKKIVALTAPAAQ